MKFSATSPFGEAIAHIDHIHPYSKLETYPLGVSKINDVENLQALCPSCNLKKGVKS